MKYKTVAYEKIGSVGVLVINRPAADNTINLELCQEFSDLCIDIRQDENVLVLVITGAGEKYFSAGFEKNELALINQNILQVALPSVSQSLAGLMIPLIAAVNGDALGQGLELALACDIRIAVNDAHFGLPQVTWGLMPWDGGTQRLPRLVGRGKAMEMLITGQIVDAVEAYRIGLVSKLAERGELMPLTVDLAQSIAAKAPIAVRYAKEAVLKGMDLTLNQGLSLEADLYSVLQTTEDRTEGVKAFLEKRSPKFKGV